jgi:O-antigen/teichoic acid export membrane protein
MINVIRQIFRIILSPTLIILGLSVLGAIIGYIIAFIVGFITSLILFYKHYLKFKFYNEFINKSLLIDMLRYGLPLYLSNTLQSFLIIIRGIILAYFTTNFLIGNFNVAMNFTTLITIISSPIAIALFPAFSKLNKDNSKTLFIYSVKYTSAIIIPATIFVLIMSKDLIFLIYGESYTKAPLYLSIYSSIFLLSGFGSIVIGSFFNGIGDTKINFKSTLIYTCLFIPLALILTKIFQIEGFLISIILATIASVFYSLRIAYKKYNLEIDFNNSIKIYLTAFIASIPIIIIQYLLLPRIVNIIISILLYIIIYLTILPFMRILNKEDIEYLVNIFIKIKIIRPIVKIISDYEIKIINFIDKNKLV